MASKNSEAATKRWSTRDSKKRSEIMSKVRTKGWAKVSPELRREHALRLVEARKK